MHVHTKINASTYTYMYTKVHTVNAQKRKKKTTSHGKEMRVYSGATLSDHGLGIKTSVTHIPCSSVEAVS